MTTATSGVRHEGDSRDDAEPGSPVSPSASGITRRHAVLGGLVGAAAVVTGIQGVLAQDSGTPASTATTTTTAASSSPQASPTATATSTPTPEPTATPPSVLTVVTDQQPAANGQPVSGGDLRMFVSSTDFDSFNPAAFRQDPQVGASYLEPMLWPDNVTMEPKPWLVEAWRLSSDGLTLELDIRHGVTWHDDMPFTAADVAFALQVYRDDIDSAVGRFFSNVDDIKMVNAKTTSVTFTQPDAAFVFNACTLPVFPAHQYGDFWNKQEDGNRTLTGFDFSKTKPIGTGPWTIDSISDDAIAFKAFASYWQDRPHADTLTLTVEDDGDARLKAWQEGKVDLLPVSPSQATSVYDWTGTLYVVESPVTMFAAFNFNNPANVTSDMMKDSALREALTTAVDRVAYRNEVFAGYLDDKATGTITQPWAHDTSLTNPAFDLAKARKILADGGWSDVDGDGLLEDSDGNKLDLYCVVSSADRPELIALLQGLNDNFNQIGARLTVQVLDPADFLTRWVDNHQFDMVAFTLVQYPAFDEYDLYGSQWNVRTNSAGWNPGSYDNAKADAALEKWFAAKTEDQMKAALTSLQQAVNDDLFGLWFGFPRDLVLVRPGVEGFQPNKMLATWDTRLLWKTVDAATPPAGPTPTPTPSPTASPAASPGASPEASPPATPAA
ncbi:MAG: ABC transporter substrate-binding protein [Thermomicrobiales bacterium]